MAGTGCAYMDEKGGQQVKSGWREEVKGVIPGVPIWQSRVNNEVRGN